MTRAALRALRRIAAGLPAFAAPATGYAVKRRRVILAYLHSAGYTQPGKWAPVATAAGLEAAAPGSPGRPVGSAHVWTPRRLEVMRRTYRALGPSLLAERLGVTPGAAAEAARRAGIASRRRRWSVADYAALDRIYVSEGPFAAAEALGRPLSAVYAAASARGLRAPESRPL